MALNKIPIVILGAGPAGVGTAWRIAKRKQFEVTVIERSQVIGGNSGSFELAGLRVDYGSHRLHPACAPEILRDIQSMLGPDLLNRPRHGRIRLHGRWVHFPLKPVDLALRLPLGFALGVGKDTVLRPKTDYGPETFVSVLEKGLGRTICRDFYFPYAKKIWGVSPDDLDAEQARRRVSAGSVTKLIRKVLSAVPGFKPAGAGRFFYPRHGFGAIGEAYRKAAEDEGAQLRLETSVTSIGIDGNRAVNVQIRGVDGASQIIPARHILSTIPVSELARLVTPAAPEPVLAAGRALRFRAMLLIYLVLETEQFTEFDAHYFPGMDVGITRLSEPKNYGLASLPGRTVLCAELPCFPDDAIWQADEEELGRTVKNALEAAGLPVRVPIHQVVVKRLRQAYPVYMRDFGRHFQCIDSWLGGLDGILTFGRQGLFAHDNTHHALAMAYAADRCLGDDGSLNSQSWAAYRQTFESHVVED